MNYWNVCHPPPDGQRKNDDRTECRIYLTEYEVAVA